MTLMVEVEVMWSWCAGGLVAAGCRRGGLIYSPPPDHPTHLMTTQLHLSLTGLALSRLRPDKSFLHPSF